MKITHLASATEVIEVDGVRVLTDPWLVDGEYFGSWYHDPPYEGPIEGLAPDFIYISHIHPDHLSPKTMARLDRDIPVLIHRFASPFLKNNIERLGYQVTELDHGETFALSGAASMTIFAADNCNPELCARFFGCAPVESRYGSTQIDTLSVITDGKKTVLNTNDCPFGLAHETLDVLKQRFDNIDLLLVGYAGAGPYPQCFHFDDPEDRRKAEEHKEAQFLNMALEYIGYVRPRFFMPYAGTYQLGGSLSVLNDHRGVPDIAAAYEYLTGQVDVLGIPSRGVILNSQSTFDLVAETTSAPYTPGGATEEQLLDRIYDYQSEPAPEVGDLLDLIPDAYARFERKRAEIGFSTNTRVLIEVTDTDVVRIDIGSGWRLTNLAEELPDPGYVLVKCDPRLLLWLLKGPRFGHWNNAEIGSHLQFRRDPDVFERGLYHCLYFLHA